MHFLWCVIKSLSLDDHLVHYRQDLLCQCYWSCCRSVLHEGHSDLLQQWWKCCKNPSLNRRSVRNNTVCTVEAFEDCCSIISPSDTLWRQSKDGFCSVWHCLLFYYRRGIHSGQEKWLSISSLAENISTGSVNRWHCLTDLSMMLLQN